MNEQVGLIELGLIRFALANGYDFTTDSDFYATAFTPSDPTWDNTQAIPYKTASEVIPGRFWSRLGPTYHHAVHTGVYHNL